MSSKRKGISVSWTKHLKDPADIKRFQDFVHSSQPVLTVLSALLEEKIESNKVFKQEDYKDLAWAYAAADRNGYVRALTETINLIKGIDRT